MVLSSSFLIYFLRLAEDQTVSKAGFLLGGLERAERGGHCLNNRLYAIENGVTPRVKVEMSSTFTWRNRPQANQIA